MNKKPTGIHELGSVSKPLIMALGLGVGKVLLWQVCMMLPIKEYEKHQTQDCLKYEK